MQLFNILVFTIGLLILYTFIHSFLYFIDGRDFAKLQNGKYNSKFLNDEKDPIIIGKSNENIFWFMQVTDLHLSKFNDKGRTQDLHFFCKDTVPLIGPDFVLASGDLTDAKSASHINSRQYTNEWITYHHVLKESGVLKKTNWMDIRGNHDSFNVPHLHHADNLFRQYSRQGRRYAQSYLHIHKKSYGSYSIIGLDVTPNPGPKWPYNFFGVISSATVQLLQHYTRQAARDNVTIWFGHYPTSIIVSPGFNLKSLIGRTASVYLCGHLHTLYNFVPKMYTLQPQGFMELELADWKDKRRYRIGVVDHDLISFSDLHLNEWPAVVISNPKHAMFLLPHKEPTHRILTSTHVRILAWSNATIKSVRVFIDNTLLGQARHESGPLYVLPWKPKEYDDLDEHVITVEVVDSQGRAGNISQPFNVHGIPRWEFGYLASLVLLGDQAHNVRVLYYTLWTILLLTIASMKVVAYKCSSLLTHIENPWFVALYRLAGYDHLFYPFIIYLLYSACCPLMFGQLIDGHWGAIFVYGLFISNSFVPEALPYVTEFIQNATFILPLLIYMLNRIRTNDTSPRVQGLRDLVTRRWCFCVLCLWQLLCTLITVYMPYGLVCALLSPCRLWLVGMATYMLQSLPYIPSHPTYVDKASGDHAH